MLGFVAFAAVILAVILMARNIDRKGTWHEF